MSLAICAVVRNELPFIEEWLVFHYLQGVSFFLLYENQSTDRTDELLEELQKKYFGRFTINIQKITENPCQFLGYDRGLKLLQNIPPALTPPKWCAFLDCDEFLYSPKGEKLTDVLRSFEHKAIGQVVVHWVFHGSNGNLLKDSELVVRRFTKRDNKADKHVKSIVNIKQGIEVGRNPHHFIVNGSTVDENGTVLKAFYGLKPYGTIDILRIAHFHTKSKEEYFERKKKPDPGTGVIYTPERLEEMFKCHDLNLIEDTSAAQWASRIREEINR